MNKIFTLVALASVTTFSVASADHGRSGCASGNCGAGQYQYQNQQNDGYNQQRGYSSQGQAPQGYYNQRNDQNFQQRNDQNFQRNTQYDYQQSNQNQSYNQDHQNQPSNQSYNRDQQNQSNQSYNRDQQNQSNQSYNRDQQRNDNTYGSQNDSTQRSSNQSNTRTTSGSNTQYDQKYSQDTASNTQDRELNAKIRNQLSDGWFSTSYETVVLKTNNGVVTLSGTVDKMEDGQKLVGDIKAIEGVKSVNNQLTVKNTR
ncbi:MAG: BON domain-containing protein [Parachlamydiaceae bacterium]|nr:BON domain-containing protein [Parachlamydiaceae bacterium]